MFYDAELGGADVSSNELLTAKTVQTASLRSRLAHWWLHSRFQQRMVRVGLQCGFATATIMCIFSTPAVWDALSFDPILANPTLFLVFTMLALLFQVGTGLACTKLAFESVVGSVVGASLAIPLVYLVFGINGASWDDSVGKAFALVCFGGLAIFCITLVRFRYRQWTVGCIMVALGLAIPPAGIYHTTDMTALWRLPVYWFIFGSVPAVFILLVGTFFLPIPLGGVVRRRLAKALRNEGSIMVAVMDLLTSELDPATGRLAAASSTTASSAACDSGLQPLVAPIYSLANAAGQAMQEGFAHLAGTGWEWEAYRAQHRLPRAAHNHLLLLSRTLLSAEMNLTYSLQTGSLQLTAVREHAEGLRQVASAFNDCAAALADVIQFSGQHVTVEEAIYKLSQLESSFAAVAQEVAQDSPPAYAGGPLRVSHSALALHMVLSMLFVCATRLRRMLALLPEALGRDQPGSRAPVSQHFATARAWDLAALGGLSHAELGRSSASVLRQSLLSSASEDGELEDGAEGKASGLKNVSAADVLRRLERPTLMRVETQEKLKKGGAGSGQGATGVLAAVAASLLPAASRHAEAALAWMERETGFTRAHLSLGAQAVVSYASTMVLVIVPAVQSALHGRAVWAVFMSVVLHEPVAGGVVWKSILRISGTVVAGLLGLGSLYFAILCNHLSFDNNPAKFIAMTVALTVISIPCGMGCVRYGVRNAYFWIISLLIAYTVALPGYSSPHPMPVLALWRLVCTALGAAIQMCASSLVFPVTARQAYTRTMAAAVKGMAAVADQAFHSVMPVTGPKQLPPMQASTAVAAPPQLRLPSSPSSLQQAMLQLPSSPLSQDAAASLSESAQGLSQPASQQATLSTLPQQAGTAGAAGVTSALLDLDQHAQHAEQQAARNGHDTQRSQHIATDFACSPLSEQSQQQAEELASPAASLLPAAPSAPAAAAVLPSSLLAEADPGQQLSASPEGSQGATTSDPSSPCLHNHQQQQQQPTSLERPSPSGRSDMTVVSIYADVGTEERQRVFGRVQMRIVQPAVQVSGLLAVLGPLSNAVKFEWSPFQKPHRFKVAAGQHAQRLVRRQLNVLTTFAIMMDSHHTSALPLLHPHGAEVAQLIEQLREALLGMGGVVLGEVPARSCAEAVLSLEVHVQQLLLRVLLTEPPPTLSDEDVILGLAFVAVLLNCSIVARLLCVALTEAFCKGPVVAQVQRLLSSGARWAADDELLGMAMEIVGVAL